MVEMTPSSSTPVTVLSSMNPLSSFGQGVKSKGRLAADEAQMRAIQAVTARFAERGLELVHIRFPTTTSRWAAATPAS